MPIDINLLRKDKGGDPDIVKASELKRQRDGKIVDEVIELDNQWRKTRFTLDKTNEAQGKISKEIAQRAKESKGQDKCEDEKAKAKELGE